MQQYRVNYSLLIGLVVGTLVFSGAVYGLWKFQIERKSGVLMSEARRLKEAGEIKDATDKYGQYLTIHGEDVPAKLEYANALVDLAESDDVAQVDMGDAMRKLETILRNKDIVADSGSKDVRKRVIKIYGKFVGTTAQALDHLNLLLESEPNNAELQAQRATYLAKSQNFEEALKYSYQLIGYDPKTDKFDAKNATHDAEVYATVAAILRSKKNNPELAERVADQMVEVNPKSAEAYIQRGRLRLQWNNADGAKADAAQALQLKPDDLEALMFAVDGAAKDEKYDKAQEFVDKAKKLYPAEARVYQAAAVLEMQQQAKAPAEEKKGHYDKALAELDEGIKKVPAGKAIDLQLVKAEVQIPAQDIKGARQTIEALQAINKLRPEFIEYYEARILVAEGKWFQASEALNKIRPAMAEFGKERAMEVDYNLALCYERLGRYDMAKAQYEAVLAQDQANEPAKAGIQRTDMGAKPGASGGGDPLTQMINDILKLPKEQQDWSKVDAEFKKIADARKLDPTTVKLFQAQMMMTREDYDGAAKALGEAKALSPKNLQVQRMIVGLARTNPKVGPARAMDVLNKTIDQFGDLPALRLDKADILIQMNKGPENRETLKRELASLATGVDKWTTQQKSELWGGLAGRYLNLNMLDEGRQYLTLAADNQPNELPLRLMLFSLALDAGDDAGMKEAQDKILQIVGDQNDSAWLYAEARRRLQLVKGQRLGVDALPQIRALANQANQQRPDWSELQALRGEIELAANNLTLAAEYYDRAEELGRPAPLIVAQHIKLLAAMGRVPDAGKLIDRIPEQARQLLLGQLYAELLFRTKQVDAAIKQAKKSTEDDPKNVQNFYWYGQLLARSTEASEMTPQRKTEVMGEAIKAMRQAAELQPEFAEAWFALINYYAMQKDEANAQKTLRDAQLAMSGDKLQVFLARSYELLHRWFDAETMYREIYETAPDDLGRAQQLAAFYTGPIYQRPDREAKAAPLINQILKAGADKKVAANDPSLLWARRMAAKMLSSGQIKDYQNMLKAEKLLCSNSQEGNLLIEDKLALAEILAQRPEPSSRMKAIKLLEEVDKVQKLNEAAQIQLGDLYFAVGDDWSNYTTQMTNVTSQFPNSAPAREAFARKLIERGDARSLADAARHVQKLNELAPNAPSTFELTVRLAGKNKNPQQQQKVRALLLSRMPKLDGVKELDDNQARGLGMMASLLTDLGDLDSAEKIYTDLAARNHGAVFELAKFLGLHRDPEKCFAKLNEVYKPADLNEVLTVALAVARERRDKIGEKFDPDMQRWLDAGLRENPDSIALLVTQADMYDLQKKYQEAADIYRKLLARNDLEGIRRAIVLNNLAFLLALDTAAKSGSDDPLKMVQEAADIMGPNSAILDTRAVVLSSQKDFKGAIRDSELSVTDEPDASKYYHKAVAHLGAASANPAENQNAIKAWEKAESMGLDRNSLNRMEFEQYDDMKSKIDQLRKRSVTQAEPRAKAG